MAVTQLNSEQIGDGKVARVDLNTTDTGKAVVRKIVAGTGVTLGSTGVDTGTGDVTINTDAVLYTSQSLSNAQAHQARVNLGIDGSQFVVHTDFQVPSGTSSASNTISVDSGLQLLGSVVYHVKIDLSIATSNVTGIIQTQNGESILVIAEVVTASASNYTFTETTLGVVFKKVGDTAFFIYDTTDNTLISTTAYGVFPSGGTTGQVLAKSSNANGAVSWQTVAGGGGGGITEEDSIMNALIFG